MRLIGFVELLIAALLIGLIGYWAGCSSHRNGSGEPVVERVDTLVICDTIKVTEPVYVSRRVIDSVLVPVTDTMRVCDTLFILLEREQVEWHDSLSVVHASGIQVQVDSVRHFVQQMVITKEMPVVQVKRCRWGLGVQAGYGASREGLTPYLGVGVSYNLLSW